jgi:hypothetical protein
MKTKKRVKDCKQSFCNPSTYLVTHQHLPATDSTFATIADKDQHLQPLQTKINLCNHCRPRSTFAVTADLDQQLKSLQTKINLCNHNRPRLTFATITDQDQPLKSLQT